jgi:hypothetical protein
MADAAIPVGQILSGFLYDTTTTLTNADFFNKVVQFDDDPSNVASGEATYIFAGPPILNKTYKGKGIVDYLRPVGAVQQYSLNEGKQIVPFQELGSKLKRYAAGVTQYSASLARVLTNHGNLDYALYSWLPSFLAAEHSANSIMLAVAPGVNRDTHWVSKESEVYLIPFGLLCISGTAGGDIIHAEYLERCFIQGGGNAKSAGSPLIVDNVSIMVTRPVPFVSEMGVSLMPTTNLALAKRQAYVLPGDASMLIT